MCSHYMIIDFCQICGAEGPITVLPPLFIHLPILQSSIERNQKFLRYVLHEVHRVLRNSAEKLYIC